MGSSASVQDAARLADAVVSSDRRALARAITLVESTRPDHRATASELLEKVMPYTGNSIRVGVSGAPGVGKSTFIESLGNHVIDEGRRVAALAVDPSSTISGGSILGDKTRMETLARRPEAYIRPSPSGNTLGGVTRRSRETLLLCEAAGFDVILVETVGVGQSETKVADMTDMFVLLLLPGGGDRLQGIKRGIMELADLMLINKADDDTESLARHAAAEYRNALQLLRPRTADWKVEVLTCSSRDGVGIDEAWAVIARHQAMLEGRDLLTARRADQARRWMWSELQDTLLAELERTPAVKQSLAAIEDAVVAGSMPATVAAEKLISIYLQTIGDAQ